MRYLYSTFLLVAAAPAFAQDMPLSQVVIDGQGWKSIRAEDNPITSLAADREGHVYVAVPTSKRVYQLNFKDPQQDLVEVDKAVPITAGAPVTGLWFGADGKLYGCQPTRKRIVELSMQGETVVAEGLATESLVVTTGGQIYCTVPSDFAVYRIDTTRKRQRVDAAVVPATSLTLWPDEGTLVVGYPASPNFWACRIDPDGSLSAKDRYYAPRIGQGHKGSGVTQTTEDVQRRLYAATREGVQVFDPTGRLSGVLSKPERADVTAVTIGGPGHNHLFIGCGNTLYLRKIKPQGAFPLQVKK